jgi:hypothetical protein
MIVRQFPAQPGSMQDREMTAVARKDVPAPLAVRFRLPF